MKVFDLPVMDRTRKSFYGKAKVIEHDNGDICLINTMRQKRFPEF